MSSDRGVIVCEDSNTDVATQPIFTPTELILPEDTSFEDWTAIGQRLGKFELNSITCGEASRLLAALPASCIDLTVTSPPYDDLRSYKGFTFDFEPIAAELFRVTKPGGVVVWVVGDATVNGSETGTSFRQALGFMELGMRLHDTMIYGKNTYTPLTHNRYEQQFEFMFVFSKEKPKAWNPLKVECKQAGWAKKSSYTFQSGSTKENSAIRSGQHRAGELRVVHAEKTRPNIWFYDVGKNLTSKDKIAFQHPATFPEALARDHIISWSNPGDVVLDPMAGSGTTCKAAKQQGRRWIGFDCSEEYCELARLRVEQANPPLFAI